MLQAKGLTVEERQTSGDIKTVASNSVQVFFSGSFFLWMLISAATKGEDIGPALRAHQ